MILGVGYRADVMETELKKHEERLGIRITLSYEDEPLGTGIVVVGGITRANNGTQSVLYSPNKHSSFISSILWTVGTPFSP